MDESLRADLLAREHALRRIQVLDRQLRKAWSYEDAGVRLLLIRRVITGA